MTTSTLVVRRKSTVLTRQWQYNGASSTSTVVVDSGSRTSSVIKTDSTRRRKPVGWLYPLPYSLNKNILLSPRGSLRDLIYYGPWAATGHPYQDRLEVGDLGNSYGDVDNATPLPPVVSDGVLSAAETRALLKLKDQRVNLGVALAETRQLGNMVASTATRIARAYSSLRKGRWKSACRSLGIRANQTNNWLELQYGWKPLLSDIHGVASAIASRDDVSDWVVTVKALVKEVNERGFPYTYAAPAYSGHLLYHATRSRESGYFVRLDYVPLDDMYHLPTALGLTNPLEIAWEVVPFSFVVDWFVPVGNFLSTLDATLGFQFLSGSKTQLRKCTYDFVGVSSKFIDGSYTHNLTNNLRFGGSRMLMTRSVYASSPFPSMRVKNPLSLGHVANGLSLMAQVFGRR